LFGQFKKSVIIAGTPVITVTPLPLRPFVSLPIRTIPSPRGALLFLLQEQPATGLPQLGHILPCSVE